MGPYSSGRWRHFSIWSLISVQSAIIPQKSRCFLLLLQTRPRFWDAPRKQHLGLEVETNFISWLWPKHIRRNWTAGVLLLRNQQKCAAASRIWRLMRYHSLSAAVAVFTVRRTRGLLMQTSYTIWLRITLLWRILIRCRTWVNPALPPSISFFELLWFIAQQVATC